MSIDIASAFRLDLSSLKKIEAGQLKQAKLAPDELAKIQAQLAEAQAAAYRIPVPGTYEDSLFATVEVNGQVVAKLTNNGFAETSNALAGRLRSLPSMGEGATASGPALARQRAEEIAKALGGKVMIADTAMTQTQWQNKPAIQWTTDWEAMQRDQQAALGYTSSPQTRIDVQTEAQKEDLDSASQLEPSAKEEFLKFANMTPAEKLRAMFLADEDLTEEDLKAMPPDERQKIEDKIAKRIEDAIRKGAGIPEA